MSHTHAPEAEGAATRTPQGYQQLPVLIIGAGITGLLLAQALRGRGIAYRVFERDINLETRGVGWGLTLHWSLPALRRLLPAEVLERLPEAYVDRQAVERGEISTFPFYDLSSGKKKAGTPRAPEGERIRVTRRRLREVIGRGVGVEWGKAFRTLESHGDFVTVKFEDGSSCVGGLVVGCDGSNSRVRRVLFPDLYQGYRIPVGMLGVKVEYTPEQIAPLRELDPFFFQGSASGNDTFVYFSMLDAPGNTPSTKVTYTVQIVVSWPLRPGFFGNSEIVQVPPTNEDKIELMRTFARTWAEPFRSLVLDVPEDTEVKALELADWVPPRGLRARGRAVLMGDAMHAMAMYRGEGANHAIVDVLDCVEKVMPELERADGTSAGLRVALDLYEDTVVERARPAVLASRRACLDAHDWPRISEKSPLLSRRAMRIELDEDNI